MKTNRKIVILGLIVGFALVASPAFAQTYSYVSINGQIRTIEASTASLALAQATDITPHSGVIEGDLLSNTYVATNTNSNMNMNTSTTTGSGTHLYAYVNAFGNLDFVLADSPQEAITNATNTMAHSGVMLVVR